MLVHGHCPLISIIMPVYNGRSTLDRALQSVLNQTFSDWELLLIDDCSTDGSADILRLWEEREPRIKFLCTPENSGQCAARNLGLRHARGEFVCYLDQDDEYHNPSAWPIAEI
ncbi:MAG: glycosyltransferase family 2 protein [Pirellulales bacterium]|nr:glycosyltransferase family 2 protein [Pirellulales bacterium]